MNGRRALEILNGFSKNQLAFTAKEIDELLKAGIVVESDPRDIKTLQFLEPAVLAAVKLPFDEPTAPAAVAKELAEVDEKLKSSWSRLTTRDSKVKEQETERRTLRRALAMVNDRALIAKLTMARARASTAITQFAPCPAIGDELYAISAKGGRVHQALALRADRYAEHPLAGFMKQFDKTESKMDSFGTEIATLSANIGPVKKNPHQVVIGLAKTGMPAAEAIGTYKSTVRAVGAPDVAVTYARNAGAHGGLQGVAEKLKQAQAILRQCGFPETPEVMGAAKTLLPFENMNTGAARFVAIANAVLGAGFTHQKLDLAIKCTARLMSSEGTPAQVVGRVTQAIAALRVRPTRVPQGDTAMLATALASMVRDIAAIDPLVERFRHVESELVRAQVGKPENANGNALECVSCPGTPVEVVDTVRTLAYQVAFKSGRQQPNTGDVAVAVSFAKRFAF